MLEDAAGIRRVVLACGTVDLRKGIDGLATIIGDKYGQNPFEKGTLFLFCGKRSDRCKGLLWISHSLQEQPCQSYTLLWLLSLTPGISSVQCCKALPLPDSGQISSLFSLFSLHLYVHIPYTAPPFLHEKSS